MAHRHDFATRSLDLVHFHPLTLGLAFCIRLLIPQGGHTSPWRIDMTLRRSLDLLRFHPLALDLAFCVSSNP